MKLVLSAALASTACCMPALAGQVADPTAPLQDVSRQNAASGDIIVTARRREETLLSVPVSVSALNATQLQRYKTDSLEKVGELNPGVVIGQNKTNGGGMISIRGISTSPTVLGFEQTVLVNIDGMPISNGRVVALGFFDLQRVEILKGPQALLFGKNNTAGVISIVSADPTPNLSTYGRLGYEFVADEIIAEGGVSGPLSDTIGGRVAVRARTMKGWMYNDSRAIANPFNPAFPIADPDHRLDERDLAGRITLKFDPSSDFTATLKLFGSTGSDDGAAMNNQVIGGCLNGRPRIRNVVDPFGECRADNHTTAGKSNATVLANGPDPKGPRGKVDVGSFVLNATYNMDWGSITSTTGYMSLKARVSGTPEVSTFSQLFADEKIKDKSFSQEIRLTSALDGPINFMVGGFYQDNDLLYIQDVKLSDNDFNPSNGQYRLYTHDNTTDGKTYSAFGQLIVEPVERIEIAGGVRYTKAKKDSFKVNTYSNNPAVFPVGRILTDRFRDSNISPEVTLSYRPSTDATVFAAYRTGFKSGGYALGSAVQATTAAASFAFGSEKAKGFEVGAKGQLFDKALRMELTLYSYKLSDLQVNAYNPETVSVTVTNAASLKQRGADFQAFYRPVDQLELRGALLYNRNRFGTFLGQCYSGQTSGLGCSFPGPSQNLQGRAPSRSPDWSGSAGFTVDLPVGNNLKVSLSGDAFYTSSYYAADTLAPSTRQKAFWRENAAIRLGSEDNSWDIGLIGRNLSNKYYLITASDKTNQPGEQRGSVSRGREIMVQAGFKF